MKPNPLFLRARGLTLTFALAVWGPMGKASPQLDAQYQFRTVAAIVVNLPSEPVHGAQVQRTLHQVLDESMRFQRDPEAEQILREAAADQPPLEGTNGADVTPYGTSLTALASRDVDAAFFVELQRSGKNYHLFYVLVVPSTGEVVHHHRELVLQSLTLDGFASAAKLGAEALIQGIPFDGAVIRRDGYRVVIDVGYPTLRQGMRLPAYTLERKEGRIRFLETGIIKVTRAEKHLSFGKIITDRYPEQVTLGNKVRVRDGKRYPGTLPVGPAPAPDRQVAMAGNAIAFQKGRLGNMNLTLGASMVNHSQTTTGGAGSVSRSVVYPGGTLRGELWLTRRWFLDLGVHFATALLSTDGSGSTEQLNSNLSNFSSLLGYRLSLSGQPLGPTVYVRTGYGSYRFLVDTASDPNFLRNANYAGMVVGGGADLPFSRQFGLRGEIQTLIFPSFGEGALTSAAVVDSVFALDFSLRGYYNMSKNLDLEARIWVQSLSAQMSGTGTAPVSLASTSRSIRAFLLGLTYYF